MKIIKLMCLLLLATVVAAAVKKISKKASAKFLPTPAPRQSRHSGTQDFKFLYDFLPITAGDHKIQNEETHTFITNLENAYNALTPDQQEVLLDAVRSSTSAGQQPKTPVYHATPLEPYGALLDHREPSDEEEHQSKVQDQHRLSHPTVVVTPKPFEREQQHEEQNHSAYYTSSSSGKVTEAIIKEPKNAPLVYKTHDRSLHRYDEQEPQSYAAKYQFAYQVRDPKHGTYFGHSESRDGDKTNGNYHVLLPDGRLQNVQYWADHGGYHAQVSYNQDAKHPSNGGYHRQLHQ